MPCTSFHCPDNEFLARNIDDCEACDHKCLSIETLRLIWKTEFIDGADHYHNDPKVVSVTETMGCLRRAYYDRSEDYTEAPASMLARVDGTNVHSAYERANNDGNSEVALSMDLGAGYSLKGTADRLTNEYVADYKTMQGVRKTYDENNAIQLSIYDEMAGGPERELIVIQRSHGKEQRHYVHRVEGALDKAVARAHELINAIDEGDVSMLSPEGRDRNVGFTGKPMCNWCPHFDVCDAVEEKAVNE
jgi:hypothetical protein